MTDGGDTGGGRSVEGGTAGDVVSVDVGVERLLRLLWLFRHRNRSRTIAEVEQCGYPDLHAEGSTGRKNFFNDRARLEELGVTLEAVNDHAGWAVTGDPGDVMLILTPAERDAITEARLLVAEDNTDSADRTVPAFRKGSRSQAVPAAVPMILAAISDRLPVRFRYGGHDRFIDPYRVAVTPTDRWYLLGIDRNLPSGTAERTFRIDRISVLTVDRDGTVPACPADANWPLHPVAWGHGRSIVATVRFPHAPLPEWLAMLGGPDAGSGEAPAETVSGRDNDPVDMKFPVANHEAFVRRTLAIGATITGPAALVELARSTLHTHMLAYGPL